MTTKAFLLAAGEGTRLQPYTSVIPKSLLPIGGKPVLRWILERLKFHGLTDVVLCINKSFQDQFEYHVSNSHNLGFNVEFSISDRPLGTAGEIYNARKFIDGPFILYYGDELTKVNLTEMMRFHKTKKDGVGTLALVCGVPIEVGVVDANKDVICNFHEKPPFEKYTWAGIAILEPEILKFIKKPEGLDLAKDVFPSVIKSNKRLYAYKSDAVWLDVGGLAHYKIANEMAKKGLL